MQTVIYTVQAGDSLSLISKKLYGDFSMVDKLIEMNKIVNPNLIHPGQQLLVPDVPGAITEDAVIMDSDTGPMISTSTSSTSSASIWQTQVGKWFPWIVVAAAAGILYYSSQKEKKKNKALSGPNTSPEATEKIKEIVKLKEKRNRLPKSSKKRPIIQSEIDHLQKEYDLMTA